LLAKQNDESNNAEDTTKEQKWRKISMSGVIQEMNTED
jgi:hypothetical protein